MLVPKDVIRQKQLEAQMLFLMDMPIDQIAKKVGVHDVTVNRWASGMGWREARKQIAEQVTKKMQEAVTEMKERHLKLSKAIQIKGVQTLQKEDSEVRPTEMLLAMKHEKEMVQPTEYKQLNFYKNETNIQNNQLNINESIHDLIEKAKQKAWKKQSSSIMETLDS